MARRSKSNDLITTNDTNCSSFRTVIIAKNEEQKLMMSTVASNIITFVKGLPGTGKTYIAIAYALQQYFSKKCEKIVFSRPVVEAAGEKLGFLPGDIREKIDPYMTPVFETLSDMLTPETIKKLMNKNGHEPIVRVIPMAYMRGTTFKNSVIICDESQNTSPEQIRMLLTRLGENSQMIICGDTRQSDISGKNGLQDAFDLLTGIEGIGFVTLSQKAIVRHPVIGKIEQRYEDRRYNKPNDPGQD